ncbi:MAG: hypothetical protein JST75_05950 [Bacteroidetes bacterium]|nr:hypothetical protein [Bacteroidota bacterium]
MKAYPHIVTKVIPFVFPLILFFIFPRTVSAHPVVYHVNFLEKDTVPKEKEVKKGRVARYFNIITDRQQRDSLLKTLSKKNAPAPVSDSVLWERRENNFTPYRGNKIRYIYYNRLKVFGTMIEDTSYNPSKLIRFANKLHFDTREWMIKQSLFFRENDTVNAYKLVDNERYLRSLPFIQDARIYVINTYQNSDSIDIVVVTKDIFEYGGSLTDFSPTNIAASVFNTNAFGAGQRIGFGFKWDEGYSPQWRTGVGYSKYNLAGSFTDVSLGYSFLNDRPLADTGVYERAYYLSVNRPLYSSWAKFTGGLTLSYNTSVNIRLLPDSVYASYRYNIVDVWAGYNFRNQFKNTGFNSEKPNIAVELRRFDMTFTKSPFQKKYDSNSNFQDHTYVLGKLVFFHQDFFKTNYFFGFGRTEDIPLGYNAGASFGLDQWANIPRTYTAVEAQKYWLKGKNVISTAIAIGSFWHTQKSEDAVIHVQVDYYSNLFRLNGPRLRQFIHGDYLVCPNPVLYRPLNINKEFGILGYRNTMFNGYQRLNLGTQTNYYSPLNIYGFKFNFYMLLQASLLAAKNQNLFTSPFYSAIGLGVLVRNENLAFNTISASANYLLPVAGGPRSFFFQVTSTSTLSFNIFALQAPALISFR